MISVKQLIMKPIFLISLIFIALIFHNAVIMGTTSGLLLWYRTLVPALLPFIIITNALSETHAYNKISNNLRKYIPYIYGYSTIFLGNLCGYPIGAKILNDFVSDNHLSFDEANSLLSFSSQASPMFLLGYVYPLLNQGSLTIFEFLSLIYIPNIILYLLYRTINCIHISNDIINDNYEGTVKKNIKEPQSINLSGTFMQAVNIIVIIGVYVIIFSIILNILMPVTHNNTAKCLLSFLEITNGLKMISSINIPDEIKTGLILSVSSFGGLCTAFQIKSVLTYSGASIKKYLRDKIILSAGTLVLTMIYISFD